jgi:hypothetical protein
METTSKKKTSKKRKRVNRRLKRIPFLQVRLVGVDGVLFTLCSCLDFFVPMWNGGNISCILVHVVLSLVSIHKITFTKSLKLPSVFRCLFVISQGLEYFGPFVSATTVTDRAVSWVSSSPLSLSVDWRGKSIRTVGPDSGHQVLDIERSRGSHTV